MHSFSHINLLFRNSLDQEEEFEIAKQILPTFEYRTQIPKNSLVIGRYSVLPFYQELEKELILKDSKLINSYEQHNYIADITNYYEDVKDFTPKLFTNWYNLKEGRWIVKGRTNSRKFQWNTHMYADSRESLLRIASNLLDDSLIKEQGIVVRDYVPLKKIGEGINGLPISKEWRCFYLLDKLIASGYYWASHMECNPGALPQEGLDFANKLAKIVSLKTNFFVLDIAEKEEGGYILVEINDGQMSGLSAIDPIIFYTNLKALLYG